MANQIQIRNDTEANLIAANPILAKGEQVWTIDTNPKMLKIGDGVSAWSALSYFQPYSHPTGDGNLHVPATGTENEGNVLTAGATAGSLIWAKSSGGGANLALLAHSNSISSNTDTDYSIVGSASIFASSLRFKREKMKFYYIEKGNGSCQFVVSDGTNTVTATGTNANSSTDAIGLIEADCSALAYGGWWMVEINSKAVTGAYEIRRINFMADPASPMTGNPVVLSSPGYPVNSATPVLVERKFYPTHYLIDADASIVIDAKVLFGSGCSVATLKTVITPVLENTGTLTTPSTSEENSTTITESGTISHAVRVPIILAPMIKIDFYFSATGGTATVEHISAFAEV